MKNSFMASVMFFLTFIMLSAQDPPDTLWTRTFGGGEDDDARSSQMNTDGGFIIAAIMMIMAG